MGNELLTIFKFLRSRLKTTAILTGRSIGAQEPSSKTSNQTLRMLKKLLLNQKVRRISMSQNLIHWSNNQVDASDKSKSTRRIRSKEVEVTVMMRLKKRSKKLKRKQIRMFLVMNSKKRRRNGVTVAINKHL